ncbi:MAG: MBL fold metallo-hydrolase [Alphaproteobacteria bacterium]|nr:MBL fold metallo-hydrolase [Alphaproteobacteria bacterium]
MKITVLGCGSSGGVPLIGNNWGDCDPNNPRNRRSRVSVLVEEGDTTLLVDTSPDMRQQLLDCNLQKLTAVLFTHDHADHTHGIDDLRGINWLNKKPVDIYADSGTMKKLEERFGYVFRPADHFYKPSVKPNIVTGKFSIGPVAVTPFLQGHGYSHTLGYRFNDFAYSTDVKSLDDAAFDALRGIKVWIVDCVREEPHPTHSHLEQTLEWIARVKPERAYLTHMNHTMDYARIAAKLPPGVWPAHDGLVIEC